MNLSLRIPTPDLIRAAVRRFDDDERYGPADRLLSQVFDQHPANTVLEGVLLKVVLVNSLYNANVFAFMAMARHILQLQIDAELAAGSAAVVGRIAPLTIRGETRRHYAFATKYCSWHRRDVFPIYDNLVERLLWQYRTQYKFAAFARADLQEYPTYRGILTSFRDHFGLDAFSFKEIDKFLWLHGKDLFG
jgi:hypothetical protein